MTERKKKIYTWEYFEMPRTLTFSSKTSGLLCQANFFINENNKNVNERRKNTGFK